MSINLLPQELIPANKREFPQKAMAIVLLLGYCCISVFAYGFLAARINSLTGEQAAKQALLAEKEALQVQLATLEEKIERAYAEQRALQKMLDKGPSLTGVLTLLQYHLPPGIRVEQILLSGEGWASVEGEAGSLEAVSRLAASLGSDSSFPEVQLADLYLDQATGKHRFILYLLTEKNGTDPYEL